MGVSGGGGSIDAAIGSPSIDPFELERARVDVIAAVFDEAELPPRIGRYVVLEQVGKGSSGVVYKSYDPELDRRVAIKLLRAGNRGLPEIDDELLREARAIARLNHPNVVAVHDVGTVPRTRADPGGLFVVMEFVDGESLAQWLQRGGHGWSAVLDALMPVGEALSAAHALGVVHRDVKPANVLLGRDRRAKLADFGLAHAVASTDAALSQSQRGDPFRHAVVGTPATMAPEQHEGRETDARTDQYGYCATLFMALHGRAPFAGRDLEALLAAKRAHAPQYAGALPRWLVAAIHRGLSPEPAGRFADMAALLEALRRGRGRTRRWLGRAAVATSAAAVVAFAVHGAEPSAVERCVADGQQRAAAVWNDDARASLRAGLLATAAPQAERAALRLDAQLATVAADHAEVRAEVCASLDVVDPPPAQVVEQLACLDGTLSDIGELVALAGDADADLVRELNRVLGGVTTPRSCVLRPHVEVHADPELDVLLRRARLHERATHLASAEQLARTALALAEQRQATGAAAQARDVLCHVIAQRDGREPAIAACDAALFTAESAGDHLRAALAAKQLMHLLAGRAEAERVYGLATAHLAALVQRPPWLEIGIMTELAWMREREGRLSEAAAIADEALTAAIAEHGPDDIELVSILNGAASLAFRTGRLSRAQELYQRAIDIQVRERGDDDPDVAVMLHNLGGLELERGEPQRARATLTRALAMRVAAFGERSPRVTMTLLRLARATLRAGDGAEAEALARTAVTNASAPDYGGAELRSVAERTLAWVLAQTDRCAEAIAVLDGVASPLELDDERGEELTVRGGCQARRGDPTAGATLTAAMAAFERFYGDDARDVVAPALLLAAWHRERHELAQARVVATRALEICRRREGSPAERREVEALVAALE